jgi:hypothetical protein
MEVGVELNSDKRPAIPEKGGRRTIGISSSSVTFVWSTVLLQNSAGRNEKGCQAIEGSMLR